ncbi:MAG: hypothetical protein VX127_02745, partial [Myxococcota bacterium]|nr:hypothetical protein [Myxococcota bacterium]
IFLEYEVLLISHCSFSCVDRAVLVIGRSNPMTWLENAGATATTAFLSCPFCLIDVGDPATQIVDTSIV